MKNIFSKKIIDKTFEIGILIKAVFGFFEILGGILFAFSEKILADNFLIGLAQQEIAHDPNDFFANNLLKIANNFSNDNSQVFAIVYLLFHGIVNILLAGFVLKGKVRAYPAAIAVFSAFLIYQIYKYFHTFSLSLLFLTIFDLFVITFIWLEYKRKIKHKQNGDKI